MFLLLALIALVFGQPACDVAFSKGFPNTIQNNGEFLCCGPQSTTGSLITWRAEFGARCSIQLASAGAYYPETTFAFAVKGGRETVASWGQNLAPIIGGKPAVGFTINNTDVSFQFNSTRNDNCDTKVKLVYQCSSGPRVSIVLAGRNETLANSSTGFSYFRFPPLATSNGTFFYLSFSVNGYQGLKPPVFYVANEYLPGLDEGADFVVPTSKSSGNKYIAELDIEKPRSGNWIVGLYSYGRFTNLVVDSIWAFDIPQLVNEQTETTQITKQYGWSRQIIVPPYARGTILFEYARERPGGQTTFLVGQGFVPEPWSYSKKATTVADFGELSLTYPFNTSNPGVFIFRALTDDDVAGFTVRATWKTV